MTAIGCGQENSLVELQGRTMATSFSVGLVLPPRQLDLDALQREIEQRLVEIENIASTYARDSEISRFNRAQTTQWQPVTTEFCRMLGAASELSRISQGAFDITVGAAVDSWGFGSRGSADLLPNETESALTRAALGDSGLTIDCSQSRARKEHLALQLDLSAWVKGYAVDELSDLVASRGVADFVVEVGGEVRAAGLNRDRKCFVIAIEAPQQGDQSVQRSVNLCDAAIATSGDYRNYFVADGKRYSHAIDPRTARPVDHSLAAVSVVSERAASADALATALLVMGPEIGPDFADDQGIAALFAVREATGIRYLESRGFEALSVPD